MANIDPSSIKWDAAPAIDPAKIKWDAPAPKEESSMLGNLAAGVASGFADLGDTLINAGTYLPGKVVPAIKQWNDERNASLEDFNDAHKDSTAFSVGRVGGNIAATYPVGGVVGGGLKAVAPALGRAAPVVEALGEAVASGGFRGGNLAPVANAGTLGKLVNGAANVATRAVGGAINGGISTAAVHPEEAGTGAIVGAALPVGLQAAGKVAGYAGRAAGSLVKPFTPSGQDQIADAVIRKFAGDGPRAIDAAELVAGSKPTLAEATGNAGIATLQRGVRDIRPNAFVERETLNDAARTTLFDDVAGDAGKLAFFRTDRAQAADDLYGRALDPANQQELTPYLKGQITQLLKRPSVNEARKVAQQWAIERGEKPTAEGSMRALHDIKTALDDKIAQAVQGNQGGQVKALEATKNKLLQVMEKISPDYAAARTTYAEMSGPINAMETLQGLRLTDAQGNMTLSKVKNALDSLRRQMDAPGANAAKSVSAEQIKALESIYADLLRKSNTALGKSAGSNTFQNLATDQIISSVGGMPLSALANKTGAANLLGQAGKLLYSGPNEAIRNRLVDKMLNPASAQSALSPQELQAVSALQQMMQKLGDSRVTQGIGRAAPVLTAPALSSSP